MRCDCCKILAAFFSRFFLSLHATLMILVTVLFTGNLNYCWLLILDLLLFVEMAITLWKTKKGEWKWFSPMVFLYLCCVIPCVFVVELEFVQFEKMKRNMTAGLCDNVTSNSSEEYILLCEENVYLDEVKMLEQTLIIILVIGRWLMPKGHMTRDQLAQLLLLYLALGADILDILQLIKDPKVIASRTVAIIGLSLFSWSVLQFTLVLTQTTSSEKMKSDEESQNTERLCMIALCSSEMWSVIISVVMQDGPFFVFRTYLKVVREIENDLIVFFICKNILTIIIQVFRVVSFLCKQYRSKKRYKQTEMSTT